MEKYNKSNLEEISKKDSSMLENLADAKVYQDSSGEDYCIACDRCDVCDVKCNSLPP